jgi:hypothetical protein
MDDELETELENQEQETDYESDFDNWVDGNDFDEQETGNEADDTDFQDTDEDDNQGGEVEQPTTETQSDTSDPWANATEQQRAEYERIRQENAQLQHKFQSHDGRVVSLRNKITELEQQLAQRATSPTSQESAALSTPELEEFANEYPDIANAVDQLVNHRLREERAKIQNELTQLDTRFNQTIQPFREAEVQRTQQQQLQALGARHPDWREVAQSADFLEWLNVQPEPVRTLYNSDSADDASWLLDTFKGVKPVQPVQDEQPEPRTGSNQRKLQQAVTPRTRRAAPQTGVPDDFDAAFDYYTR